MENNYKEVKKETLCNKEMNRFIMDNFYKNNNEIINLKNDIKKLNINKEVKFEGNDNQLDIISILFSLVDFVNKYKDENIKREKLKIVDKFIESNEEILEYYNKKYHYNLIDEKGK